MPPATHEDPLDMVEWRDGDIVVVSGDGEDRWIQVETPEVLVDVRDLE